MRVGRDYSASRHEDIDLALCFDEGRGPGARLLRCACSPASPATAVFICREAWPSARARGDRRLRRQALLAGRGGRHLALRRTARSTTAALRAHDARGLCDLRHPAVAPLVAARRQPVRPGAVPRPDAGLQGRGDAAPRPPDGPRPRRARGRARPSSAPPPATPAAPRSRPSAACDQVDIFILYPHGRVSDVQRRQMTTVADANVHAIALEGHVRRLPGDREGDVQPSRLPRRASASPASTRSTGRRIVAQIVYYFTAAVALGAPHRPVSFVVPTGNFGDIFAGYAAKRMGLPIDRLVIATNVNDILARTLDTGAYEARGVVPTSLALDGHPGLVEFRAPAVRGSRPRRDGALRAPDGRPRRSRAASTIGAAALAAIRAELRRRSRRRGRGRRHHRAASDARPAISSIRTRPSALPLRGGPSSTERRAGGRARHRASGQVPGRRRRPHPASSRPCRRILSDLHRSAGALHGAAQRPGAVEAFVREHSRAAAGSRRMSVEVTTLDLGPDRRHRRHAASRNRLARRLGRSRRALGGGGRARPLASPRAHGVQGHAGGAMRGASPRRSRARAATSTPRPRSSRPAYYARVLKEDVGARPRHPRRHPDRTRCSMPTSSSARRTSSCRRSAPSRTRPTTSSSTCSARPPFPDQPIGRRILGTPRDRQRLSTAKRSGNYLDAHYRAPRMVVAAAGGVDHDVSSRCADRLFAASRPRPDRTLRPGRYRRRRDGRRRPITSRPTS